MLPITAVQFNPGNFTVTVDGSTVATPVALTMTQQGFSGSLGANSFCDGSTAGQPYVYNYSFPLDTSSFASGSSHTVKVCLNPVLQDSWRSGTLPGDSATLCQSGSFTVQHPVAAPQLALSKVADAVTDPVTAAATTQTSVINVGSGTMDWSSAPDANYYNGIYNYSPTQGGSPTALLPKWLNIAMAQSSGALTAGASKEVDFTYDHRYVTNVGALNPNTSTVGFYCADLSTCVNTQPVDYTVAYTVPAPTISFTVAASGQSGNSITVAPGTPVALSWVTSNANQDAGATPVTISGVNGNLAANGSTQVTVNATTVFNAQVKGLSDVATSGNTATGTCTVNVAGAPGISVTPPTLSFSTPQGSSPAAQTITIRNSGTASLSWNALGGTIIGGGADASFNVSPTSGTLAEERPLRRPYRSPAGVRSAQEHILRMSSWKIRRSRVSRNGYRRYLP